MQKESFDYSVELTEADAAEPVPAQAAQPAAPSKKEKRSSVFTKVLLILILVGVVLLAAVGSLLIRGLILEIGSLQNRVDTLTQAAAETAAPAAAVSAAAVQTAASGSLTPAEIYSQYAASVVAVYNMAAVSSDGTEEGATQGTGSGFILSEDGLVVTNYHVIEGADLVEVALDSGETCVAEIVGADELSDLALLRISAEGLKAVRLGSSADAVVGESVCAIGNPLGTLTNTLTSGCISALNRTIEVDGTSYSMLQTDCAINEGSSGGPLFDMNGCVIGITTAKFYGSAVEGLGFAIPIDEASPVLNDLLAYGYVQGRARLGITVRDFPESVAAYYDYPAGAMVIAVEEGSCSDKAGVLEKDIITGIGDVTVSSMSGLLAALHEFSAGEKTTLTVCRAGETLELSITLDEKQG